MKNLIPAIPVLIAATVSAMPLSEATFVAFDVETTGFSPDTGRIIEIGAVKFKDGKIVKSTHWLVNPGIPIPNSFVHGIADADVAGHPGFAVTYKAFCDFAGDSVLLAHNASFDVRFLAAEIERNGLEPIPNPTLNSLALFRRWYPDAPSHKLAELAGHLDLPVAAEHRAQDDSETLIRILRHGLERKRATTLEKMKTDANGTYHFDGSRKP